jgi:GNAT superfamily N-acetyltransferase
MSALQIPLRLAAPADSAAIRSVLYQSFVEYRPLYTDQAFAATVLSVEQVEHRIAEGPVWIAVLGQAVVGTVSAVSQGQTWDLRGMGVIPSARGQGVATRLLRQVEGAARAQGCNRLRLTTTPFLTSAIRCYQRFGFERSPEGPDQLFGTPLFTMIRALEPDPQPR